MLFVVSHCFCFTHVDVVVEADGAGGKVSWVRLPPGRTDQCLQGCKMAALSGTPLLNNTQGGTFSRPGPGTGLAMSWLPAAAHQDRQLEGWGGPLCRHRSSSPPPLPAVGTRASTIVLLPSAPIPLHVTALLPGCICSGGRQVAWHGVDQS